ncbi:glutathione S-transferase Mu 1-like isoform 2-T2 [Sylvia borin]
MAVLGYWDIRGLAHAIRLLLEYTETPYEDKLYSCGEAPDYDKSQWINEKEKLGLDFPNLPYFIDGPTKLTQSNAILRYIARKHKLCGETEEETLRVDMLENQIMDFRMSLVMICYNPDFEKLKPGYLEQLPGKLKLFSNFLGDRKWFAGEKLTFVDFLMFDVLDQNRIFEPKCLEPFKNLKDFMERFGVSRGTPRSPLAGDSPDTPCVSPGSGEGGCLHEVQPFPEDAHQQQDGQVGQQEAVGAQQGARSVGGSPNPAPPASSVLGGRWHHWHGPCPHLPPRTIKCFLDVAPWAPTSLVVLWGHWGGPRPWLGVGGCGVRGVPAPGPGPPMAALVWGQQLSPPSFPWERSPAPH